MKARKMWLMVSLLLISAMILTACGTPATPTAEPTQPVAAATATTAPAAPAATDTSAPTAVPQPTATTAPAEFTFGILFVGPYNDKGWNTAHYVAGQYVEKNLPGAKMIYVEKVNTADRPGTTPQQLAEELLSKGAKLIIFDSDDMKDGAVEFAKAHPDVPVIHSSGDTSWKEGKAYQDIPNLVNVMGRMEIGKMMAGCQAALTTKTGQIGYLGPLINDETRRLVSSAYLGAKYCWTQYLKKDIKDLKFKVTWIGFWFNIPGVTSDPTQVADDFFNSGYDVLISGIDTTEALTEAKKAADAGKKVWAIPYDYSEACAEAPSVCLGVPYFNWGPAYLKYAKMVQAGTFKAAFEWLGPDWKDINNPDTSMIGYTVGDAFPADAKDNFTKFQTELAGGLNLWTGPLNLQDKTVYLKDGEVGTDLQVWYLPQLVEGIEGQSVPSK